MTKTGWKIGLAAIVIVVLCALIFSHFSIRESSKISIDGKSFDANSVTKYSNVTTSSSSDAEKVALGFYKYYLKNIYNKGLQGEAPAIELVNGAYQLNSAKYEAFMNNSGYFSKLFYQNDASKLTACNNALKMVNPEEVTASGGSASDFVKTDDCAFLSSNQWVGGQGEVLDTASVLNSKIDGDNAQVNIVIGQKLNDTYSYNYSYPMVTLIKENVQWKITRIVLSFKKS